MGLENNYLDTCGFCSWLIPLNLNLEVFYLALEARACNLGLSAIAWSSYSVAMISISGYEIDKGKLCPTFQYESP